MTRAEGAFDVVFRAEPPHHTAEGIRVARASVSKTFRGGLVGTSETEILTVHTTLPAAYVGVERVDGVLHGRRGSFVLMHSAGSTAGTPWMRWEIVETSGTGELAGLRGQGQITVAPDGTHSYWLDYELQGLGSGEGRDRAGEDA